MLQFQPDVGHCPPPCGQAGLSLESIACWCGTTRCRSSPCLFLHSSSERAPCTLGMVFTGVVHRPQSVPLAAKRLPHFLVQTNQSASGGYLFGIFIDPLRKSYIRTSRLETLGAPNATGGTVASRATSGRSRGPRVGGGAQPRRSVPPARGDDGRSGAGGRRKPKA